MTKIICVGSSTQDIFLPTSEGKIIETPEEITSKRKIAFELGAKYKISERFESLGGCSANVAAGLSRQGIAASHYTAVGKDMIGEWIIQKHREEKIGTELLEVCDCKSDLSMILVDKNNGDRTIFHHKVANEKFEFNPDKIINAEWIYVGDIFGDWEKVILGIIDRAVPEKTLIAFNPRQSMIAGGDKKLLDFFGACEVVFLNKDEAIEILLECNSKLDSEDEEYLLTELKKTGAAVIAITDGERGAWAIDGKEIVHVDAIRVDKVADMTGAGDAFASGFLAAYIKGESLEDCVRLGIKNGASVVKFYGGIEGLLRESEIK